MMVTPEEYVGKTVKMDGQFGLYCGTNPDGTPNEEQLYYACVIADATGCLNSCWRGIRPILTIIPSEETIYPSSEHLICMKKTAQNTADS